MDEDTFVEMVDKIYCQTNDKERENKMNCPYCNANEGEYHEYNGINEGI